MSGQGVPSSHCEIRLDRSPESVFNCRVWLRTARRLSTPQVRARRSLDPTELFGTRWRDCGGPCEKVLCSRKALGSASPEEEGDGYAAGRIGADSMGIVRVMVVPLP